MSQLIAVTGATGFIGNALCTQLKQRGFRVRALVRDPARAPTGLTNTELFEGDVTNADSLEGFINGASVVVHCAGNVRGARQADFDRVNVDGLGNLLKALDKTEPPPRLFNLSSLAAREPELSFYAASKHKGEQLLFKHAQDIEWAALRPPPVYGPGDKELLPLLQMMTRGFALIPGETSARFSMIYIDDLVDAVISWIESPKPPLGILTLEDGTEGGYDWQDIMRSISALSGHTVRRLPVPAILLDTVACANRSLARLLRYSPMLTPEKLRELRHDNWVCDSATLNETLGWKAKVQLGEGIQRTLFPAAPRTND